MSQTFTYGAATPTALANVRRSGVTLVEMAESGGVGMGAMVVDDEAGTAGYASDAIVGLKWLTVDESACATERTFTGYLADRTYSRGDRFSVGTGRQIDATLVDLNASLGFRIITGTDGKRSKETVGARLTWLLGSDYLTDLVIDAGYVVYPTTPLMDAVDYRGQTPLDVLGDCALAAHGYNYFVYYDTTADSPALWFDDSNTSTAFASTLKISNVAADCDGTTTFPAHQDARLARDPQRVVAGVYLPYSSGSVYETRPATATTFAWRDRAAPNANVKTAARATDIAQRFLLENSKEDDRLSVTVRLPASAVNLVRAGQRMEVKFSHLPGYASFTWCRVLKRTVTLPFEHDNFYDVALELSPQEIFTVECCGPDLLGGVLKRSNDDLVVPPWPGSATTYVYYPHSPIEGTPTVYWLQRPATAGSPYGGPAQTTALSTINDGVHEWGLVGAIFPKPLDLAFRVYFDFGSPKFVCQAVVSQYFIPDGTGFAQTYLEGSDDGTSWSTIADSAAISAATFNRWGGPTVAGETPFGWKIDVKRTFRYMAVRYEYHDSTAGTYSTITYGNGEFMSASFYTEGDCA